jgi:hypothetical protein
LSGNHPYETDKVLKAEAFRTVETFDHPDVIYLHMDRSLGRSSVFLSENRLLSSARTPALYPTDAPLANYMAPVRKKWRIRSEAPRIREKPARYLRKSMK